MLSRNHSTWVCLPHPGSGLIWGPGVDRHRLPGWTCGFHMMDCRGAGSVDSRWAAGVLEGFYPLSAAEYPGVLSIGVP